MKDGFSCSGIVIVFTVRRTSCKHCHTRILSSSSGLGARCSIISYSVILAMSMYSIYTYLNFPQSDVESQCSKVLCLLTIFTCLCLHAYRTTLTLSSQEIDLSLSLPYSPKIIHSLNFAHWLTNIAHTYLMMSFENG